MNPYRCDHLDDAVIERELAESVVQDSETTAYLLSRLAVFDARRLAQPTAYPTTYKYCVYKLRMSGDVAYKRIRAARAARRFPVIFAAIADRRLTLSAVVLVAPHLQRRSGDELLAAAMHKTNAEIALLLAERFPQPDVPASITEVASPAPECRQLAARPVEVAGTGQHALPDFRQLAARPVGVTTAEQAAEQTTPQLAVRPVQDDVNRTKETPLSPRRFSLTMTVGQETHEKLRRAQDLLGHAIAPGDLAAVVERALDALIAKLEQRKFAATEHPRLSKVAKGRHIPADVKRAVRERDGDQCTFRSEDDQRCEERGNLEFDHEVPVARGGPSTFENVRMLCAAHNQHCAEREFGKGFMDAKRGRAEVDSKPNAPIHDPAPAQAAPPPLGARPDEDPSTDVKPWLRRQGFSEDHVRDAAAASEAIPDAPIHERVRYAMAFLVSARGEPPKPAAKRTG